MSDIFEEVDESLRQDRALVLWRRFAPLVWGAAALIVGGTALYELYLKPRAEAREAERLQTFEAAREALEAGQYETAKDGFAQLIDDGAPIASIAAHYQAQALFEGNGDEAGAAAALQAASEVGEGPLQRLALLKSAYFEADALSLDALEARIGGLAADESPLGALAQELIAAKAMAVGDVERARREFQLLRFSPVAPGGVPRRAEAALAQLPTPVPSAPQTEDVSNEN